MNRQSIRSAGAVALCAGLGVSASAAQVTANWLAPVSGSWTDPTKWSTAQFPNNGNPAGTTYHARLGPVGGPYTVTLNSSVALDRLTINAGQAALHHLGGILTLHEDSTVHNGVLRMGANSVLDGAGDLTIRSKFELQQGELRGAGGLIISAEAEMEMLIGTVTFSREVQNKGVTRWADATLRFLGGSFVNEGLLAVDTAPGHMLAVGYETGGQFNNTGVLVATGGNRLEIERGSSNVDFTFNNSGLVQTSCQQLILDTNGSHSGQFEILENRRLTLLRTQSLTADASITGVGTLHIAGGVTTHAGVVDLEGALDMDSGVATFLGSVEIDQLRMDGGTARFKGGLSVGAGGLVINGGTLEYGDNDLALSGIVTGTIRGEGDLTVSTSADWRSGTMGGAGRTIVEEGAELKMSTSARRDLERVLELRGVGLWTAGDIFFGGAVLENQGVFRALTAGTMRMESDGVFDNSGLFEALGGDVRFGLGVELRSTGVIAVRAGTLTALSGLDLSGSVEIDTAATLRLLGDAIYRSDARITGSGTLRIGGGTHDFGLGVFDGSGVLRVEGGVVTLREGPTASLELLGGAINFEYQPDLGSSFTTPAVLRFNAGYIVAPGASLTISGGGGVAFGASDLEFAGGDVNGGLGGSGVLAFTGPLLWKGGVMDGEGTTILSEGAVLTGSTSAVKTLSRTLDARGDVVWSAGNLAINGGTLINREMFTATGSYSMTSSNGGSFINEGTLVAVAGATQLSIGGSGPVAFVNNGEVRVEQGVLQATSNLVNNGEINIAAGATLRIGGTLTHAPTSVIQGAGALVFTSGNHVLDNSYIGVIGRLGVDGGSVHLTPGLVAPEWALTGGTLTLLGDALLGSTTIDRGVLGGDARASFDGLQWGRGDILAGLTAEVVETGSMTISATSGSRRLFGTLRHLGTGSLDVGVLTLDGGHFLNEGEFRINAATSITATNAPAVFSNTGLLTISGAGTGTIEGVSLSLENTGTIRVEGGSTLRLNATGGLGSVVGQGSVEVTGGSLTVESGDLSVAGSIRIAGGNVFFAGTPKPSSWAFAGGAATFLEAFQGGSQLITTGTALRFEGGVSLDPGAIVSISGLGSIDFDLTSVALSELRHMGGSVRGGADVNVDQVLRWTGGTMTGAGRTIVSPGATATIGFFTPLTLSRELVVQGSANWGSASLRLDGGTLRNEGVLTATANQGGTAAMSGLVGGGVLRNEGTLVVQGGGDVRLVRAGGDMGFENAGVVEVREGSLGLLGSEATSNEGVYEVWHTGAIEIDGEFANASNAALSFEVGGMKERGLSGLMTITGEASLAGTLTVSTPEAFEATWGDRWVVMSYGSVEGDFDVFDLPTEGFASRSDDFGASDLRWYAERGETEYEVGVSHIADIDHDGLIGFSDLNVIASNFNAFGSWAQGDVDGDGFVGFADLNVVLSLFNVAAPRSVPGPGGVMVLALAGLAGVGRRVRV